MKQFLTVIAVIALLFCFACNVLFLMSYNRQRPPRDLQAQPDQLQPEDLILLFDRDRLTAVTREQPAPTTWTTEAAAQLEEVTATSFTTFNGIYYGANGRHYQPDYRRWRGVYSSNNGRHYQPEGPPHPNRPAPPDDPDRKINALTLSWSPDGRYAVYEVGAADHIPGSLTHESPLFIYDAVADESRLIWQGLSGDFVSPVWWSPDGRYLLVQVARQLHRWDQQALAWTILSENALRLEEVSPNGRQLLWFDVDNRNSYLSDASGNDLTPLAPHAICNWHYFYWSPDGRYIACQSQTAIYLIDWQANTSRRLYRNNQGVGRLAWSPDSRQLAFTAATHCRWNTMTGYGISGRLFRCDADLFIVSLEGNVHRITTTGASDTQVTRPGWLTKP